MLRAILISVLTLLPMGFLNAQSDPQLKILNPVGFVRPGDTFEIHAELVNPADSGVVVQRISGGGRSQQGSVFENPLDRQALMQEMQARQQAMRNRMRAGMRDQYPVIAGSFPLYPGESLQFVVHSDQMPLVAQPGQDIRLINLSVKLDIGSFISGEVYADFNTLRVASADGSGDETAFQLAELVSDQAGTMFTDLYAEFSYPPSVSAGESFTIEATISNRYDHSVNLQTGLAMLGGFREWEGEHKRSFRFVECHEECQKPPELMLGPGESASFQLGTYYYENDSVFEGELVLDGFMLSVVDHVGRHEIRDITTDPVRISVIAGADPRVTPVSSEALQILDLYNAGDQMLVYDPNTGNEWLKLTAGEGYTPQEILRAIQSNGEFSGFRLASAQDVETLYLNHLNASGVELRDYAVYEMVSEVAPLQQFVSLMGNIPTVNETLGFSAIVSDDLPAQHDIASQYTILTLKVTKQVPGQVFLMSSDQGLRKHRRSYYSRFENYTGYWLLR